MESFQKFLDGTTWVQAVVFLVAFFLFVFVSVDPLLFRKRLFVTFCCSLFFFFFGCWLLDQFFFFIFVDLDRARDFPLITVQTEIF